MITKKVTIDEFDAALEKHPTLFLLDVRPTNEFINGFIPGSIHLPATETNFINNLRKLGSFSELILLVSNATTNLDFVVNELHTMGRSVIGYLDYIEWAALHRPLISLDEVFLKDLPKQNANYTFVDVRTVEEYQTQSIPDSITMPIATIESKASSLPMSKKYITYCAGTYRALNGAAKLKAHGLETYFMVDGIHAWLHEQHRKVDCDEK